MLDGDLIRFAGAIVGLIGLGVVMGFSPTLIAVALRVLTHASRPDRAIGCMLIGLVIGSTVLLLLLQIVDPRSFETLVDDDVEKVLVRRSVDLTAGVLFVLASLVMGLRARRPRRPRKPRRTPADRPWAMLLIGASNAVIGVSGIATMYLTARIIRGVSDDDTIRVVSYAVFVVALVAPYVALAWAWKRFPRVSSRITGIFARIAATDLRPWETALTLLVGAIFLGLGIWGGRSA